MNKDNKWTMYYSWTQPYSNWGTPAWSATTHMSIINTIDNIVDHMVSYPDAERLLKNIFSQ
jgi:hypothetical protein